METTCNVRRKGGCGLFYDAVGISACSVEFWSDKRTVGQPVVLCAQNVASEEPSTQRINKIKHYSCL